MMLLWGSAGCWLGMGLLSLLTLLGVVGYDAVHQPRGLRRRRVEQIPTILLIGAGVCLVAAPLTFAVLALMIWRGELFRHAVSCPPFGEPGRPLSRADWHSGSNAGELLHRLRPRLNLAVRQSIACACCRLVWDRLPNDACRAAVTALEGALARGEPFDALAAREPVTVALRQAERGWSWRARFAASACEGCFTGDCARVAYYVEVLNRRLDTALVEVVHDLLDHLFAPLPRRRFPAEVIALARECAAGAPRVFPILADALAEIGEERAADHCRQARHAEGCHVVRWVLGQR